MNRSVCSELHYWLICLLRLTSFLDYFFVDAVIYAVIDAVVVAAVVVLLR